MDIQELFLGCRRGDLTRVQFLVEHKDVDLNVRDKWDSTPLYYACLCGYEDMVKYMLDHGAKCEANTFDGERCLYGSLSDKIKKLLKSYKQVTSSTMRRDVYHECLRRTFERGLYADINFVVQGENIPAHRCVLLSRSDYFGEMFATKWKGRNTIHLTNKLVMPRPFKLILNFLYTGQMDVNVDDVDDTIMLAKQCRLNDLMEKLEHRIKKVITFESQKPGVLVTVISVTDIDGRNGDLQNDLTLLADHCLPKQLCNQELEEMPFPPQEVETYPDVIFNVGGRHFNCHKMFFCGRSDYFKACIEDHFGEISIVNNLPVIPLQDVTIPVFLQVLYYIYTDSCQELDESNVYDVLCAADMYLLPGLKRLCSIVIAEFLDFDNVTSVLKTAEIFNLPRLEDQCASFIAANIEKMVEDKEFAEYVKANAGSVKERQETDTIPIIDDVRYHIANFVQTFSDMYEADQKLALIDNFLEELELDG